MNGLTGLSSIITYIILCAGVNFIIQYVYFYLCHIDIDDDDSDAADNESQIVPVDDASVPVIYENKYKNKYNLIKDKFEFTDDEIQFAMSTVKEQFRKEKQEILETLKEKLLSFIQKADDVDNEVDDVDDIDEVDDVDDIDEVDDVDDIDEVDDVDVVDEVDDVDYVDSDYNEVNCVDVVDDVDVNDSTKKWFEIIKIIDDIENVDIDNDCIEEKTRIIKNIHLQIVTMNKDENKDENKDQDDDDEDNEDDDENNEDDDENNEDDDDRQIVDELLLKLNKLNCDEKDEDILMGMAREILVEKRLDLLKNNIIIEKTPLGNVLMFYNNSRKLFEYYSDNSIPYKYLETVSRKYVCFNDCKEIYVDMESELKLSLDKEQMQNAEKEKENAYDRDTGRVSVTGKNVFANFKSYNKNNINVAKQFPNAIRTTNVNPASGTATTSSSQKPMILKNNANRYSYQGKMINYNFLQKIDKSVFQKKLKLTFAQFRNMII
jgi:hypothetical protein